ncbi:MAG: SDR family oxidoreductase [Dehalococcoidia bacterium]|nr:SDR family oxidoreductase [Dehalococcoidia bacterium]MSQ35432.1 SDR family oxidoreductase [Dehalococcoidia bacterium]
MTSPLELAGKVAIVTGAGRLRGIGRESALVLARMGADVVITGTGRDPKTFPDDEKKAGWKDIESVAGEIRNLGRRALPVVVDVSNQGQVEALFDRVIRELGRVDVMVNNAAAPYGKDRVPVIEVDPAVFEHVIKVKVMGTFFCSRAAVKQMLKQGQGGRIVNLSSTAGKRGTARMAAYNASNFAVDGFTQALAKEVALDKITVNSVCPGLIETARMDPLGRDEFWQERVKGIPMGRVGEDWEVAELIGYLCSPRAAYITGQAISINGGALTER